MKTGLAGIRSQFAQLRKDINSEFSNKLVGGGLLYSLYEIVKKGQEIANISDRFGVMATSIQEITNAAEPHGATMLDVAQALNKTAIAQDKVKHGGAELRKALDDLKIDYNQFIALNPHEAFMLVADAVKNAEDKTLAYGAVVEIMGRKAGALFPVLEMGSEAIRQQGQAAGVMSEEVVEAMQRVGQDLTNMKNGLMSWGASILDFIMKGVKGSIILAEGAILYVTQVLGGIGKIVMDGLKGHAKSYKQVMQELKDTFSMAEIGKAMHETMQEELHPETKKASSQPKRDLEDTEAELRKKKEIADTRDRMLERWEEMHAKELEGEEKINELIKNRDRLAREAEAEGDELKKLHILEKAMHLEEQIIEARKHAAKQAEHEAEEIAKKKEHLDDKLFRNELDNMKSNREKLEALEQRRAKKTQEMENEKKEAKKLDIASEIADLDREMDNLRRKAPSIAVSHIQKIGGGGAAHLSGVDDAIKTTAKEASAMRKTLEDHGKTLHEIARNTHSGRWK